MPDHPKVVGLPDAAFRLYVEALCWCSRHLTDGMVPVAALKRLGGYSPKSIRQLVESGLIVSLEARKDTCGYMIHDYTEHQRTADEVADYRRLKRSAGVTGNHERWHVARGIIDPSCELCEIDDASHVRSHEDGIPESQTGSQNASRNVANYRDRDRRKERKTCSGRVRRRPRLRRVLVRLPAESRQGPSAEGMALRRPRPPRGPEAHHRHGRAIQGRGAQAAHRAKYIPFPATWLNGERYNDSEAESAGRFDYPTSPWAN